MKKKFLKGFLLLFVLIFAPMSYATDWMPIDEVWDIDLDSIKWLENNQFIECWLRNNIEEENEKINDRVLNYIYYHEVFNPKYKLGLTFDKVVYDTQGKQVENISMPYGNEPMQIPPSSFYDYLCNILNNLTLDQIEDSKAVNKMGMNIPFGTTFEHPNEDMQNYNPLKNLSQKLISTNTHKYKEKDYINMYCNGKVEYPLSDKTRVDCMSKQYAVEFEFAPKWKEAIGQSLYYAKLTNKKPAIAIIMRSWNDEAYINRIKQAAPDIAIFRITAF